MGQPSYTYNAQGRAITAGGSTISYDAFNREVELQTTNGYTQFVYAPDGFKFAYMHGQSVAKYVAPLTAGLQAVYTAALPAPPAYWRHSDWLGTVHLDSTPAQTVYFDGGWAPFGEIYAGMGTSDRSFTGQTQDTGAGLYDFLLRQYSPTQGRWLVPDPAGLAAVDITNPQTWNRYAYVANNPLNAVDPKGLYLCETDAETGQTMCDGNGAPGGGGGGGGDNCDAECMLQQAEQGATLALNNNNSNCASVVDGGTGIGLDTLSGQGPGTITMGNLPFNEGAATTKTGTWSTYDSSSGFNVSQGFTSTTTVNSNPLGLFVNPWLSSVMGTGTGTGYTNQTFQTIEILHEMGHVTNNYFNLPPGQGPSAIVADSPQAADVSEQNTDIVANNCFPQGDFGGNQGPISSDPSAVNAHAIRARRLLLRRRLH